MARMFKASDRCTSAFQDCKAQLFISGGHGGLVTYDGAGGRMVKEGGPMDRLFFFRNDGTLIGDAGLDVFYGVIDIATGDLSRPVRTEKEESDDTCVCFEFSGRDDRAFEVRGGIQELGLTHDTVLVHGSIAESEMIWEIGDESGRAATLPYVAFHPGVEVHSDILRWFKAEDLRAIGAETGWCKMAPTRMRLAESSEFGVPFRTQQHLGHLRVLLG